MTQRGQRTLWAMLSETLGKEDKVTSELQKLLGPTIRDQQLLLIVLIVRIRTIIIAAISDNVSIGIPAIIVDFCTLY